MGLLFVLVGLCGSGVMLLRLVLMVSGQLKGPVLQYYQRYGAEEAYFFPLPQFIGWLGVTVIFAGFAIRRWQIYVVPTNYIGGFLIALAWFASLAENWVRTSTADQPLLPRWANQLVRETTRHERRRLAYMWLRLPLRTRLLYNASDRAFLDWADLVILATL